MAPTRLHAIDRVGPFRGLLLRHRLIALGKTSSGSLQLGYIKSDFIALILSSHQASSQTWPLIKSSRFCFVLQRRKSIFNQHQMRNLRLLHYTVLTSMANFPAIIFLKGADVSTSKRIYLFLIKTNFETLLAGCIFLQCGVRGRMRSPLLMLLCLFKTLFCLTGSVSSFVFFGIFWVYII